MARTSTGSGARLASDSSAGSRPRWVRTAGWMPRASSRSSWMPVESSPIAVVEHAGELAVRRRLALCQPKMKRDAGEAALRAVVQVALEAPALVVARRDEPGARAAQLLRLCLQLGPQPPVLQLQVHRCAFDQHLALPVRSLLPL